MFSHHSLPSSPSPMSIDEALRDLLSPPSSITKLSVLTNDIHVKNQNHPDEHNQNINGTHSHSDSHYHSPDLSTTLSFPPPPPHHSHSSPMSLPSSSSSSSSFPPTSPSPSSTLKLKTPFVSSSRRLPLGTLTTDPNQLHRGDHTNTLSSSALPFPSTSSHSNSLSIPISPIVTQKEKSKARRRIVPTDGEGAEISQQIQRRLTGGQGRDDSHSHQYLNVTHSSLPTASSLLSSRKSLPPPRLSGGFGASHNTFSLSSTLSTSFSHPITPRPLTTTHSQHRTNRLSNNNFSTTMNIHVDDDFSTEQKESDSTHTTDSLSQGIHRLSLEETPISHRSSVTSHTSRPSFGTTQQPSSNSSLNLTLSSSLSAPPSTLPFALPLLIPPATAITSSGMKSSKSSKSSVNRIR